MAKRVPEMAMNQETQAGATGDGLTLEAMGAAASTGIDVGATYRLRRVRGGGTLRIFCALPNGQQAGLEMVGPDYPYGLGDEPSPEAFVAVVPGHLVAVLAESPQLFSEFEVERL